MKNITLPGEGNLAAKVSQLHAKYLEEVAQFMSLPSSARSAVYFGQLLPTFSAIKDTSNRILEMNQENMVTANNEARRQSHAASVYMIASLLAGIAMAAGVSFVLARSIIQPLHGLTESAQQLGDGNLDQHVTVQSKDEVGKLGEAFNKMAAKLRAYRQSTTEKILKAQQTTESALRAFPDPILVFSPEKEIQLQNAAADLFLGKMGGSLASLGLLSGYIDQSLKGAADSSRRASIRRY